MKKAFHLSPHEIPENAHKAEAPMGSCREGRGPGFKDWNSVSTLIPRSDAMKLFSLSLCEFPPSFPPMPLDITCTTSTRHSSQGGSLLRLCVAEGREWRDGRLVGAVYYQCLALGMEKESLSLCMCSNVASRKTPLGMNTAKRGEQQK